MSNDKVPAGFGAIPEIGGDKTTGTHRVQSLNVLPGRLTTAVKMDVVRKFASCGLQVVRIERYCGFLRVSYNAPTSVDELIRKAPSKLGALEDVTDGEKKVTAHFERGTMTITKATLAVVVTLGDEQ